MESEIKIRLTTLGWAGIALIGAGYALSWIGVALIDWNLPIAHQWWEAGNLAFRIGGLAVLVGILTRLGGKWLSLEVKHQRKMEEAQLKGA